MRVNPRGTRWYLADLAAVVPAGPAAVMLPKCSGPDDLRALDHHLEALETAAGLPVGSVGVVPIVTETAASVFTLGAYAGVAARLAAICFGAEDLSADLGVAPRRPDGSLQRRGGLRPRSRAGGGGAIGVPALDTPWPDPRDPDGLRREAEAAAADGFAGKILIHPEQIEIANAAFTPSAEQVRWAERVRDAFAPIPDARSFRAGRQDDRSAALQAGDAGAGGGGEVGGPRMLEPQGAGQVALTDL